MKKPSDKQTAILKFIKKYLEEKGYPPSVRDIQHACEISSTSVVDYNLRKLEQKGLIRRDPDVSRGIDILTSAPKSGLARVPVMGTIAAGAPIAVPNAETSNNYPEEAIEVPQSMVKGHEDVFALRVKGTSMIDALINDGDIVVVEQRRSAKNGDMVVAWLKQEKETTLKKYYKEEKRIRLQPANATMKPIYVDLKNLEVQGRVIGVLRGDNF